MKNIQNSKKYSIGSIRIEEIEPTEDYKKYVELERLGLATEEDARRYLHKSYRVKPIELTDEGKACGRMCKAWEEQRQEGKEIGIEEGKEIGIEEGKEMGLKALINYIKSTIPNITFDNLVEIIVMQEEYRDVTQEMVKKYFLLSL